MLLGRQNYKDKFKCLILTSRVVLKEICKNINLIKYCKVNNL